MRVVAHWPIAADADLAIHPPRLMARRRCSIFGERVERDWQ